MKLMEWWRFINCDILDTETVSGMTLESTFVSPNWSPSWSWIPLLTYQFITTPLQKSRIVALMPLKENLWKFCLLGSRWSLLQEISFKLKNVARMTFNLMFSFLWSSFSGYLLSEEVRHLKRLDFASKLFHAHFTETQLYYLNNYLRFLWAISSRT